MNLQHFQAQKWFQNITVRKGWIGRWVTNDFFDQQ